MTLDFSERGGFEFSSFCLHLSDTIHLFQHTLSLLHTINHFNAGMARPIQECVTLLALLIRQAILGGGVDIVKGIQYVDLRILGRMNSSQLIIHHPYPHDSHCYLLVECAMQLCLARIDKQIGRRQIA